MRKLFLSDFDGTATERDFYKIILDDIGIEGWQYVEDYRKTGKVDYHYLNKIFGWKTYSVEGYQSLLDKVELDTHLTPLLDYLKTSQIDFKFISAGFDCYILDVLKKEGFSDLEVITNPGSFVNGQLHMQPNNKSPFYSPIFGIDKGAVVRALRKGYDIIYFAGDSEPDLAAALEADVIFAKGELVPLVQAAGRTCTPFETYLDILGALIIK